MRISFYKITWHLTPAFTLSEGLRKEPVIWQILYAPRGYLRGAVRQESDCQLRIRELIWVSLCRGASSEDRSVPTDVLSYRTQKPGKESNGFRSLTDLVREPLRSQKSFITCCMMCLCTKQWRKLGVQEWEHEYNTSSYKTTDDQVLIQTKKKMAQSFFPLYCFRQIFIESVVDFSSNACGDIVKIYISRLKREREE